MMKSEREREKEARSGAKESETRVNNIYNNTINDPYQKVIQSICISAPSSFGQLSWLARYSFIEFSGSATVCENKQHNMYIDL